MLLPWKSTVPFDFVSKKNSWMRLVNFTASFFPRENQKYAWNCFLAFFRVFSRTKNHFHAHFFASFHGESKFFTGTFKNFFTYGFFIFTGRKWIFLKIFTYGFLFSRIKNLEKNPSDRVGVGAKSPTRVKMFWGNYICKFPHFCIIIR